MVIIIRAATMCWELNMCPALCCILIYIFKFSQQPFEICQHSSFTGEETDTQRSDVTNPCIPTGSSRAMLWTQVQLSHFTSVSLEAHRAFLAGDTVFFCSVLGLSHERKTYWKVFLLGWIADSLFPELTGVRRPWRAPQQELLLEIS